MEQLQILMQSRQDIVLDDTNCFRWLRDRFRNFAATNDYRTTIVFLDIPLAEIWQRMSNNQKTQERHQVKPKIIEGMAKTFELPQSDENIIEYSATQSINEWVISHFGDSVNR